MIGNNRLPAALAGFLVLASPLAATGVKAQDREIYMGQIVLASACPSTSLEADGRKLKIMDYQAMYALLGTYFGGDGTTDFALPDLRNKASLNGARYCVVTRGIFPSRQ
jgi:microcystin-dependent protein